MTESARGSSVSFSTPTKLPSIHEMFPGHLDVISSRYPHTQASENSVITGSMSKPAHSALGAHTSRDVRVSSLVYQDRRKQKQRELLSFSPSELTSLARAMRPRQRSLPMERDPYPVLASYNAFMASHGTISDDDDPNDISRKHICNLCNKRFNRPSSLRIHINTHTGETPYHCPWPHCGRQFNVNSNMRRHYRNHTTAPGIFRTQTPTTRDPQQRKSDMLSPKATHLSQFRLGSAGTSFADSSPPMSNLSISEESDDEFSPNNEAHMFNSAGHRVSPQPTWSSRQGYQQRASAAYLSTRLSQAPFPVARLGGETSPPVFHHPYSFTRTQ